MRWMCLVIAPFFAPVALARSFSSGRIAARICSAAILPLEKDLAKATGAKKGAITKHIHRIVDTMLTGDEVHSDDVELVSGVDVKNLDKARDLGAGLLK